MDEAQRRGPATLHVREVVIDCASHDAVVAFWAAALGWQPRRVNEQYVALVPPRGRTAAHPDPVERPGGPEPSAGPEPSVGPPILFQLVPEPKVAKNRVHLDFGAPDTAEAVARLVDLGATVLAERSLGEFRWTVLADPEGNEFCVSGE